MGYISGPLNSERYRFRLLITFGICRIYLGSIVGLGLGLALDLGFYCVATAVGLAMPSSMIADDN